MSKTGYNKRRKHEDRQSDTEAMDASLTIDGREKKRTGLRENA